MASNTDKAQRKSIPGHHLKRAAALAICTLTTAALILSLSACGSSEPTSTPAGAPAEVKTLRVATGIGGQALFDIDEDGNPTGYEYELLKLIDDKIPQYDFAYEPITMTTQLPEIAAGRIDIGSHDYEDNPERRENYLFTDIPHWSTEQVFFVPSSDKTTQGFDALIGKTIATFPSSNSAYALEQYNENNPDKKLLIDYVASIDLLAADLNVGKADAVLFDNISAPYLKKYGINVRPVTTESFVNTGVYYIFPLDRSEIKAAVDKAIVELDNAGQIEALAQRVLSETYEGDLHYVDKSARDAIAAQAKAKAKAPAATPTS